MIRKLVSAQLCRSSWHFTRRVARHYGTRFPFWYVCEYPKAGGTWLSKIISNYLGIPFPQHSVFPIGCQAVLQNHWQYTPGLQKCFYLYRDGRDVMVSLYFMRMLAIKTRNSAASASYERMYKKLLGPSFDPDDTATNLPLFIDNEMKRPRSCHINWPTHIRQWHRPEDPNIALLSYEQMLDDPFTTLKRCFEKLDDKEIDDQLLKDAIERYSFERMTGRKRGEEDSNAFIRKGVSGDWVNHFTPEAAEIFDRHAGESLIQLGYENDRQWVNSSLERVQKACSRPIDRA